MLKQFLSELNITIAKQEGGEYVCTCPWCDSPKLYVNVETGRWQCFHGCGQGYPYQLAAKLTGKPARDVFEIVDRYGLRTPADEKPPKRVKKNISFLDGKLRPATDNEINALAAAKSLDPDALRVFAPRVHVDEPVAYLPVFDPADLTRPTGYLRCRLDGKPFDGGVKYPTLGNVGLFALPWLAGRTDETIIIAEAWRDMAAAVSLGYAATATWGAGPFREEWLTVFKNRDVVVIHDEDIAGVGGTRAKTGKHSDGGAVKRAKLLHSVARSVRIARLPYEWREDKGEDLHDYIVRDRHTTLDDLIEAAPEFTPPPEPVDGILLEDDHPDTFAEAYERHSAVKHRYNVIDGWSICQNGRYQRVEHESEIEGYMRRFLQACRVKKREKQEDGSFKITTVRPDKRMKTPAFIQSAMKWLRDDPNVHLRPSQCAPCSLDGKHDTRYTLALSNGLLDWSKHPYTMHPHTEKYYTLNYLPFPWQTGQADSELWIKFLVDVTGGDEQLFDLLQQWAGYCLMKHNQDEQRFLIVYGEAGTGKSVFVDVLMNLIGKNNVAAIPLEKFDDPHYVIQTYGKMLNVTDESEGQIEEAIESHLKHYTGGTMFTFKRLYHEPFSAYPTAKIMIVTNHLPAFKDTSDGVWRRLLIAPFNYIIPESERVRGLARKIIETEMPGVLKWALEGARKVEKFGFVIPDVCRQAVEEYRREAVPEIAFFEEHYEAGDDEDRVKCDDLRANYERWCRRQGCGAKSTKKLAKTMAKLYPRCERKRGRDGSTLCYFYHGLREINTLGY